MAVLLKVKKLKAREEVGVWADQKFVFPPLVNAPPGNKPQSQYSHNRSAPVTRHPDIKTQLL